MEKAKKSNFIKASILVSVFFIIYVMLIITATPKKYNFNVGDISDVDIDAPTNMVDKIATEKLRKEAEDKVLPIYKVDLTVQIELEKTIDSICTVKST